MTSSREDNLIAEIDKAFADVQLEDGVSLNMTEYNDSGGSVEHYADRAKRDERMDWRRIDGKTLQKFTSTFSFTDLKGFRFYIPAYMIWAVRNHSISDSIISTFTVYALNADHYLFRDVPLTAWFNERQVAAMVKFLEFACDNGDTLDDTVARENLQKILTCLEKQ